MIKYNINDYDKELEEQLSNNKDSILNDYERNFLIQEASLDQIIIGLEHLEHNKFKDNKIIWNIAGNISLVSYDLKIIIRDMSFAKSDWQKRHYARQGCLLILESIDNFFKLLGNDFKNLTAHKLDITAHQQDLKNIRASLNEFKTEYAEDLKNIRNFVTAHRDNEALKQAYIIKQINWSQCINIATKFNQILDKLGKLLGILITKGLAELSELDPHRNKNFHG